ncbi:hypothetical protein P8A21_05265 [Streptomyces poriferorum]|uniref:Lipoprotein n=1 Tax=Streptomyces poriferorum TaxID=2798799 RepID=A0ABY9J2G4_9ACTN|nr:MULTISPECIES: hypothetical protein [unclassified Streptomyces]MDP5310504.1 hypothetical protein [Streptomyces sp. Alt4]WLQ46950.1 hypothetical protein P8A21_05265 [Streptomyces sp. Alt1]WLQ60342.1 hypothetical protein P8A19_35165 [Streptomyces sp. Alt2]
MNRTAMANVCAAALFAAALTGCSDSTSDTAEEAHGSTPSASPSKPATVDTKSVDKLGAILTDEKGRTLYLFLADKKNKSNCTGDCAKAWPPLLSKGDAKAGKGVNQKLLDITKRSGGDQQVTYNGHPLYYYAGDKKPGQTNGQALDQFGAEWYVLDAKGKQVES